MGFFSALRLGRRIEAAEATGALIPYQPTEVVSPLAPESHLAQVTWAELFGLEARPVDRALAMSLGVVARARNVLATTAARMPLVGYRGHTQMSEQPRILTQPEVGRPRYVSVLWWVDALIFYGRAWLLVVDRDSDRKPSRFQWVPEWRAQIDSAGQLTRAFDRPVTNQADVVRIDGPHEGLLRFAPGLIRQAVALDRAAARAADNPVPSIELHQEGGPALSDEQVQRLVDSWARARRGENGGVGFTNQSVRAITHGQPAEQLLIEGRRALDLALARAVGVPAWAVDAAVEGSSLTYSNTPSRSRELVDYGLMAYLAPIEARLSMDDVLPRGQWCRFDLADLLRGDFAARMAAYKVAKEVGIYTDDELRDMERGIPLEEA